MLFRKKNIPFSANDLLQTARQFHQQGKLDQAKNIYEKILQEHPDHSASLHLLGILLSQEGQYEPAVKSITNALKYNPDAAEYYCNLGTVHYQHGGFLEAIAASEKALQLNPDITNAYFNIGNSFFQLGNFENALDAFNKAITLNPDYADAHYNRGNTLRELGKQEEAVTAFQETIKLNPDHIDAYNNLAFLLHKLGKPDDAKIACEKVLSLIPDNIDALNNLGLIYKSNNEIDMAVKVTKKALQIDPGNTKTLNNLGNIYFTQKKYDDATRSFKTAIDHNPESFEAYNNLGSVLEATNKFEEAKNAFETAISLNPEFSEAYSNLGIILHHQDLLEEAKDYYKKALEFNPESADTYNNLGHVFQITGNSTQAMECYKKALQLNPDLAQAYNNLGYSCQTIGDHDQAIINFKHALSLKPDFNEAHSNLLFSMTYSHKFSAEDTYNEHINWAKFHSLSNKENLIHNNNPDPYRKLRIGYVSPDFKFHSVAYFIKSVFSEYDRENFETIAYSNTIKPDRMTEQLKNLVNEWRDITSINDEQLAELVRNDAVDILVDLAGHTSGYRLCAFTLKPAPIQITYLGYPNTTGISTIDYRITDAYADPPGMTDRYFTEELVRIPDCFLCYSPPDDCPDIDNLPCLSNQYITFGSFNNPAKLNMEIIATWSKVMQTLPNSRIILKGNHYADIKIRENFSNIFKQHGIKPDRVIFKSLLPSFTDHMNLYNKVDIALDTFPYNGTTTTFEALWMGVPVVTRSGNVHQSLVGKSILTNIGYPGLIADSPENFIEIVTQLASDVETLAEYRKNLREKMKGSIITNAKQFTKSLEKIYRDMWIKWCNK